MPRKLPGWKVEFIVISENEQVVDQGQVAARPNLLGFKSGRAIAKTVDRMLAAMRDEAKADA